MCFGGPSPTIPASLFMSFAIDNPRWPPRPSILGNPEYFRLLDFNKQSEWGVAEWRTYAKYLEESGASITKQLAKAKDDLYKQREKSGRRTKPLQYRKGSLLTGFEDQPKAKRGRKPGSGEAKDLANRALEVKAEMEQSGKNITNIDALKELKKQTGRRNWKYDVKDRSILNAMKK